jgi:hypothetical protein
METKHLVAVHKSTGEKLPVIKVKRPEGIVYIAFFLGDPEPTVYKASEFIKLFKYI